MNIHSLYKIILPIFRRKRMAIFQQIFKPDQNTRILDVGGMLLNWKLIGCTSPITLLNIKYYQEKKTAPPNFTYVIGDATAMEFPDNSFDLAYSNSVIEHVGTFERQKKFAKEISRVAKKLWVQTPSKWFFIEPHLLTPFVHWLPRRWQAKLLRHFTVWGILQKPTPEKVQGFFDEIRLLDYREFSELFPDCEIRKEKFLFMTKSYIAIRR